jgi:hypothetical protein
MPGERWCSVHVQAVPGASGDIFENLRKFHTAIDVEGRLPEDTSQKRTTIRMAADELKLLDDVARGKMGRHDVVLRFFIYRLESLIYTDDGSFASTEFYRAISAGPPIVGLMFNETGPSEFTQIARTPGLRRPVAIGIIDDGIAFAHERFRASDTSRIAAIWLQDVERRDPGPDAGVAFGRRLTGEDIDKLLAENGTDVDVYRKIGLTDFGRNQYNPLTQRATHGTHVLDLAAGYDPQDNVFDRPILAVQLPSVATLDTSGATMGSYVVQAARQIMLWAEALGTGIPLVINFSYGLSAGPKDGTHDLERVLRDLVEFRKARGAPTWLVLPAGNSFRARTTAVMTLAAGEEKDVDWMILPDDETPNYLEVWLDPQLGTETISPVEVTVSPPDVLPRGASRPESGQLSTLLVDDKSVAAMYYSIHETGAGKRGRIFVAVNQTTSKEPRLDCAPAGRWRVTIRNASDRQIVAHLHIQRDTTPFGYARPGRQSYFDHADAYHRDEETGAYNRLDEEKCPIKRTETLSAIATSAKDAESRIVVVGAADGSAARLPAGYTSSGPVTLRDGPDCSAVTEEGDGHWGVLAAGTFGGSIVRLRGTSVSAPQLVRKIADRLERNEPVIVTPEPGDIPVLPEDTERRRRLGAFVFRRPAEGRIPRRRYPPVES